MNVAIYCKANIFVFGIARLFIPLFLLALSTGYMVQ